MKEYRGLINQERGKMEEGERGQDADMHERVHSGHRTPADPESDSEEGKKKPNHKQELGLLFSTLA